MSQEPLWTKNYTSLCLMGFSLFLSFQILVNILPLYLVAHWHTGTEMVGLSISVFLLSAVLIRPFVGIWLKQLAMKSLLLYSVIAYVAGCVCYLFIDSVWPLIVLRFFHGMTFGIITTISGTVVAQVIPVLRRGEGIGFYSMSLSVSMVIGPYIAINLANWGAYSMAFWLAIFIAIFTIVLTLLIQLPQKATQGTAPSGKMRLSLNDIYEKDAAPYVFTNFFLAASGASIFAFLALYSREIGLFDYASYFFLAYALAIIVSRLLTGRWVDRFGIKVVVYPCIALFAAGMLLLSQVSTGFMLIVSGILVGFGYGSLTPIFQTQAVNVVEPQRIVVASSMFFTSIDGGIAAGSYVMGILANIASYRSLYLGIVVYIILTALVYYYMTEKGINKPKQKQAV